jgi:hypothetical protein
MNEQQELTPVSGNSKTILWVLIMVIFVGGFIFIISRSAKGNHNGSELETAEPATLIDTIVASPQDGQAMALLEGTWSGSAYQSDIKETFDLKLICKDGVYTIDYPSIGCGGTWQVKESDSTKIVFQEALSYGQEICNNDGTVVVSFEGKDKLKFQYYFPDLDSLNAVGQLHRIKAER